MKIKKVCLFNKIISLICLKSRPEFFEQTADLLMKRICIIRDLQYESFLSIFFFSIHNLKNLMWKQSFKENFEQGKKPTFDKK